MTHLNRAEVVMDSILPAQDCLPCSHKKKFFEAGSTRFLFKFSAKVCFHLQEKGFSQFLYRWSRKTKQLSEENKNMGNQCVDEFHEQLIIKSNGVLLVT